MENIISGFLNFISQAPHLSYWLLAFLIGCIAAFAELLSRYSEGFKILKFKESYIYLSINGFASIFAYWLLRNYNMDLGLFMHNEVGKVIIAGLSSMVILRSSFASIKNGDKTFEAGFAPVLQIFLNTADRTFDQSRSQNTIQEVGRIMKGVDFDGAHKSLPLSCFSAMQNLSEEEQKTIAKEIKLISDENDTTENKALILGMILARYTGTTLLEAIVDVYKQTSNNVRDQKDLIKEQQQKIKDMKTKFLVP